MKRIGIDCRFAGTLSGHGRYLRELIPLFLKSQADAHFVLFVLSENEEWIDALPATAPYEILKAPFAPYSISEQRKFPALIATSAIDVLFCPHFNVPFSCTVPTVVTIHDLILHRYPNNASLLKRFIYKKVMKNAVDKAQVIVAVSTFVSQEIAHEFGYDAAQKTVVIQNGVSQEFRPMSDAVQQEVMTTYDLRKPFYLYVGNAKEHKNVPLLLQAWKQARLYDTQLILVLSGKEKKTVRVSDSVRVLHNVPDAYLPALYSAARCFVSASVYEGFGLPIAEARACGCPIIACKKTAIPEVAGPHAKLIEPTVDAFVDALQSPPPLQQPQVISQWKDAADHLLGILLKNAV